MSANTQKPNNFIKKHLQKAEISRQAQSLMFTRARRRDNCAAFLTILMSFVASVCFMILRIPSIATMMADYFIVVGATCPLIVVVIERVRNTCEWQHRAAASQKAITAWTTWIREASALNLSIGELDSEDGLREHRLNLENSYNECVEISPVIPDSVFLKSKYALYKKIWISKEIGKCTGESLSQIKKRYRSQMTTPEKES